MSRYKMYKCSISVYNMPQTQPENNHIMDGIVYKQALSEVVKHETHWMNLDDIKIHTYDSINKHKVVSTRSWVLWPGTSESWYSPVTKTSLWISSFRHFFWFAAKWNIRESTETTVNNTNTDKICKTSIFAM